MVAGLLAVAAGLAWPLAATADGGADLERRVKAAFLFKFLMYTEFPASAFADAIAPMVIGVAGDDGMARDLARLVVARAINRRPVVVRPVRQHDAVDGMHLLFVSGGDASRLSRLVRPPQASMLVVTEATNGLQHGSVINFRIVAQRVRFDVSLDAADKNNIKLSSRLLTVANHVHKGAP